MMCAEFLAPTGVVPGWVGAGTAWSGRSAQGADAGEDFVEQFIARWQAQDERPSVADQTARDAEQPVPQGGDHGLTVADAVPGQGAVGRGGGGELVQPAGQGDTEQRAPKSRPG
jgi:hypothetical protein